MAEGQLLGPNLIKRLLRILPWVEARMGVESQSPRTTPQVLQPLPRLGKLDNDLDYDDATGVTVSIWTGKPAADTGDDVEGVIVSELLLTSGQLDADTGVKIEWINGRWYVTGAAC